MRDNEWPVHGEARSMSLPPKTAPAGFPIEAPLTLGAEEVHLWRVDLKAAASGGAQRLPMLSPDEHERAARFHFDRDRQYFVATRGILRQTLGTYLAIDPKALTFRYSEKGKPALGGAEAGNGLAFNVSHSGDIALLAFTRSRQIGVDVEQVRPESDTAAIAARFFSPLEQQQLADVPAHQRDEAFFLIWTRKEAYIKATGDGLSLPLHQFDVSLAPREQNALLATRPDPREAKRWSLQDLAVQPGYAAAICVSGTGWRLMDRSADSVFL